jgi:hypothetical protein
MLADLANASPHTVAPLVDRASRRYGRVRITDRNGLAGFAAGR